MCYFAIALGVRGGNLDSRGALRSWEIAGSRPQNGSGKQYGWGAV